MSTPQRQFAVFDLDGTLVRWQLYHAVVDRLFYGQLIKPEAYRSVEEAKLRWKRRQSDFRTYELVLIDVYDKTLQQITTAQMEQAIEEAFDEHKEQIYTYTRDLLLDLKAKNYFLLAISGSLHDIVEKIARHYGFDDWLGTVYHHKDGKYTGEYDFLAHQKGETLQQFIKKHGLTLEGSIGVGDSDGDISMLELVERPIVFNPTKTLLDHATQKGWEVVVERKNVVYRLQPTEGSYILAPPSN